MNQQQRTGRFTSSTISALLSTAKDGISFGKPALTYINEKRMERRLGRSLSTETFSSATSWGQLLEKYCFALSGLLGIEYQLQSQETLLHPIYGDFWAGSPDCTKHGETEDICDIKCPYTLKSFCTFADCNGIHEVREKHPDGEDYYWQIVSNCCITGATYGELIVYCPYYSELLDIQRLALNMNEKRFNWIANADIDTLPYIPNGGHYKNLYIFRFEVPQADKDLLTAKVVEASKLLLA